MKKFTRSILNELQSFIPDQSKDSIIQNRANHILESTINLFEQIEKLYRPDQAEELQKRFFSSIKNRDPKRFTKTMLIIKESDKNDKH